MGQSHGRRCSAVSRNSIVRAAFPHPPTSRILLLGYRNGIQIWDCTNLGSVSEVLNLSGIEWSDVITAAVLPDPLVSDSRDLFVAERPLLGIW